MDTAKTSHEAAVGTLLLRQGLALPLVLSGVCVLAATAAYAAESAPSIGAS